MTMTTTTKPGKSITKTTKPGKITKSNGGAVGVADAARRFADTFDTFGDLMLTRCTIVGDLIARNVPTVSRNRVLDDLVAALAPIAGPGRTGWKKANLERYADIHALIVSRNLPLTGEVVQRAYTLLDADRAGFRALAGSGKTTAATFAKRLETAAKVADGKRRGTGSTGGKRTPQTVGAFIASLDESVTKRAKSMSADDLATLAKGLRALATKVSKIVPTDAA